MWRLFSGHWDDGNLVVSEKLAEGGQAEIYAATDRDGRNMVLKVFRDGTVLQDLERQFPPALLMLHQGDDYVKGMFLQSHLFGVTLLRGRKLFGRFALVMERRWGDLRRLIDQRMMHSSCNRGPPFSIRRVLHLMLQIASQMRDLHGLRPPILQRDLKASNVLVHCPVSKEPDENREYKVYVVDYECSLGVVGTGFWRAPEILQLMRERIPVSEKVFTKKCDVYSYGMVCYELVTGHIPFEGHSLTEYDMVLDGDRPELPLDLNPVVKDIIVGCWHGIPSDRPSFEDIVKKLEANAK